ncbi:MAG: disulfide bond formation protein B [Actinomycetota bacterium]|nr:disulfide bond formation protein B [Actinomycetota bacterium]
MTSNETEHEAAAHAAEERATRLARLINIAALFALVGVLAGSLHLQFGIGEQPCPLCLVQRSAMIGLAVGPLMNLLWGMRPAHYALSILAAMVGGAGSTRQILLHIADPADPGYGPEFGGFHLYTWAFVTFAVAIVGCAVMLLWDTPFRTRDNGILHERRGMRILAFTAINWVTLDLIVIALSVLPECGLGMCPDDPANITGFGDVPGWAAVLSLGLLAVAIALAVVMDRRWVPHRGVR